MKPGQVVKLSSFYMFRKLWFIVKPDCRMNLLFEFLFDPTALKERYRDEVRFRRTMMNHWR